MTKPVIAEQNLSLLWHHHQCSGGRLSRSNNVRSTRRFPKRKTEVGLPEGGVYDI